MTNDRRLGAVALLCAALCIPGQVAGQDASPGTEPIFKRLKPPVAGTTKRITVQLTELPPIPEPLARSPRVDPDPGAIPIPPVAGGGVFDWYWAAVSPSLAAAGPARVSQALTMLSQAPGDAPVLTPRLQSLQEIADRFGAEILKATVGTRVSPALALAIISVESSGRTAAVSSAGARGLMQLMPATAERFGVSDSEDAAANIRGGVAYMDWLLSEFGGDAVLALAGYNAGEGAVRTHGGVPPYAETRAYVPKVLAAWTVARGLCMTQPDLITDPCVFVGPRVAENG